MKKICLVIFLVFTLFNNSVIAKTVKADIEENDIQLFFLNPLTQKKPENKCKTSACKALLKNINEAKESIDFAIYGINKQDKIFNALVKAQKRGVTVKIIVDETSVKGKYVDIDCMKNNGLQVKVENWAGKMHQKSIIIDDANLIIGSMNFTKQGEQINDENCLIIENVPILTKKYKEHFLELWDSIK